MLIGLRYHIQQFKEDAWVYVLSGMQPGYEGTRPATGMSQDSDRILSSENFLASSGKHYLPACSNLLQLDQPKET